ncbi:metal-dependent transcriptional regulator [Humibacter albus]|uniref:metal-dependent transcriptional regulator n=1 Tax=Humibacter albus TaxID=427754 RepID=UPI0003B4C072|nr:metal-dependent transcriptional regulator [Humibacter albus]
MDDLVDTTQMYLKSVLEMEEEGIPALRARIVERLEQAGPTVSETVARIQRDGLMVVTPDRHLEFTELGRRTAMNVMRKHRLAECLLSQTIGLDWEHVHEEACRWEHVMSDEAEVRLVEVLGHPQQTPYGNPIPARDALRLVSAAESGLVNVVRLAASQDTPVSAHVRWIGEPLQADPAVLARLRRAGVVPDAPGTFTLHGPMVIVEMDGAEPLELEHSQAVHLFVDDVDGVSAATPLRPRPGA